MSRVKHSLCKLGRLYKKVDYCVCKTYVDFITLFRDKLGASCARCKKQAFAGSRLPLREQEKHRMGLPARTAMGMQARLQQATRQPHALPPNSASAPAAVSRPLAQPWGLRRCCHARPQRRLRAVMQAAAAAEYVAEVPVAGQEVSLYLACAKVQYFWDALNRVPRGSCAAAVCCSASHNSVEHSAGQGYGASLSRPAALCSR